jgi:MFS transporter, OPA family, sugar phosphate sensor protein UhpC
VSDFSFKQEALIEKKLPVTSSRVGYFDFLKPTPSKVFIAATVGYSLYYICRLSFSVVKSPLVNDGVLTELQMGIVGAALFYSYAVGKLFNGFLADRVNIRKLAAVGLLVSSLINLALGIHLGFYFFLVLWLINGWVQSMGACSFIIGLTRWFDEKRRGTVYGFWSSSHNIGEALTFVLTAIVVGSMGWRSGWLLAGALGLLGTLLIWFFFRNKPGFQTTIAEVSTHEEPAESNAGTAQLQLLKNPTLWFIALSSMFMYISRYSVNSWGIFFLEKAKGYHLEEASLIISVGSISGIVGTVGSGWISDKFFGGNRGIPTILAGVLNTLAIALFVNGPHFIALDIVSMVIFGVSIGALICFLGGLMAVDVSDKRAIGAALGIVGMASYAGAGSQDIISGYLIGSNKSGAGESLVYNFTPMAIFWIVSAALSVVMSVIAWRLHVKKQAPIPTTDRCP